MQYIVYGYNKYNSSFNLNIVISLYLLLDALTIYSANNKLKL